MKILYAMIASSGLLLASCASTTSTSSITVAPSIQKGADTTTVTTSSTTSTNTTSSINDTDRVVSTAAPNEGIIDIAPNSINDFEYAGSQTYPYQNLGYSIRYQSSQSAWADVYIYPVPQSIKTKTHPVIVKEMTVSAINDILEAEKQGYYQVVSIESQEYNTDNFRTEGRVYGTMISKGMQATTSIYLTEHDGKLFKIRLSQPNVKPQQVESEWDDFAEEIFSFLIKNSDNA